MFFMCVAGRLGDLGIFFFKQLNHRLYRDYNGDVYLRLQENGFITYILNV